MLAIGFRAPRLGVQRPGHEGRQSITFEWVASLGDVQAAHLFGPTGLVLGAAGISGGAVGAVAGGTVVLIRITVSRLNQSSAAAAPTSVMVGAGVAGILAGLILSPLFELPFLPSAGACFLIALIGIGGTSIIIREPVED